MKGYMIQNNAAIGLTFSGEASQMLDANKDLRYVVQLKPATFGLITLSFQKPWKIKKAAYAFINFMLVLKMLWKMLFMSATQRQIKKAKSHVAKKKIQDDQILLSKRWNTGPFGSLSTIRQEVAWSL